MTQTMRMARRLAAGIAMAVALVTVGSADEPVSFEGETIEWIIPFTRTGGSDTWARFNAPFLSRHLPGNPEVEVVNEPGGGATRGTNLFAATAQPDGRTILGTSGSTQFPYLLGDLRVRYDYKDWEVVMVAPTGGVVYVSPSLGIDSIEEFVELEGQRLIYASQGPTSLDLVPMLAFRLLGLDVDYVFGFTGRGDGLMALLREEVNIDYQTSAAYLNNVVPMVEQDLAVPLMSWGVLDESGRMMRDPTFPELPIVEEVYEMIHGAPPSGPDYEAYRAFNIAGFGAQKMVVLPQGTPPATVEVWRQAWRDVFEDPDYRASVHDALGAYAQVTDAAAEALYEAGTTISDDVRQRVRDMLTNEYAVRLAE